MTHFLLVRHGTTGENGRLLAGWMNGVRLNEVGRREVRALAARLDGLPVAAIYCSPLDRTRETAALLAERLQLAPAVFELAGEIAFGEWTGRDFDDLERDPGFQRWNAFRSGVRAPLGETMIEAQARIVTGLLRLREAHPGAAVCVVSHADVIKAALAHFLGAPLDLLHRVEVAPASVSTIAVEADGARVLGINDTGRIPVARGA